MPARTDGISGLMPPRCIVCGTALSQLEWAMASASSHGQPAHVRCLLRLRARRLS